MSASPVALVDCNNFYVSCERIFNPHLWGKPVVVLSNNDGCVISRSNEAKELDIEMGVPVFKIRDLIRQHKVEVWSSNYTLYASLSQRVMDTLKELAPQVEVYSIDEAFLWLPKLSPAELDARAVDIREKVGRWTGIPVSVGLAPTKTLAKLANRQAKKDPRYRDKGVFNLESFSQSELDEFLGGIKVEDIWGIGSKRAELLRQNGVTTAYEFKESSDRWIQRNLTVTGLRTAYELRGIPCLAPEFTRPPKKTIITSRAFGRMVTSKAEMAEAVAVYVSRLAEKLRSQHSVAASLEVFINTSHFATSGPRYANAVTLRLPQPTAYTPELVAWALRGLDMIYRPGFKYHKAGVVVKGLVPETSRQLNLFGEGEGGPDRLERNRRLMEVLDHINRTMGRGTIQIGTAGLRQNWAMRRSKLSPRYTTRWNEILEVPAD